ncbi:FHA domain-containing protein [Streptomyces sp. SCL15-4]|uniref:FHA domain-containing protein n=1 Tax=Streptomyces sp. SCL15-4 TaxID=2967221 RepID=UPI00296776A1|nr:FHA domain-containing protein [Streptomyces sp. SCL15-4]
MPTCPNGHQSGSDDWCEVCGHRMAGAVPPPPPPPPGAGGYGFPPPASGGRPAAAGAEAELCPQCRTPREGGAPFCEECRWNFLTNTATSYTPAAPRPPQPRFQPPSATYGGGDGYEYQGSRPSQVNRPAEPIPSFGSEPSGPTPFGADRAPSTPPAPPGPAGAPPFPPGNRRPPTPPQNFGQGPGGPSGPGGPGGASGPGGFPGQGRQGMGQTSGGPRAGGPGAGGPGGPGGHGGPGGPGGPGAGRPAGPPSGFGGGPGQGPGAGGPSGPPSGFGGGPGQGPGFGGGPGQGPGGPSGPGAPGGPGPSGFGGDPSRPVPPPPGPTPPAGPGGPGGAPQAFQQAGAPAPPAFPRGNRRPPAGEDDWVISPPSSGGPGQDPGGQDGGYGYPHPGATQAPPGPGGPGGFPQAPQGSQPPQAPHQPRSTGPATWTATIGPDREYFMAMMQRSGPEAAGLNLPAYSPEQQRTLTGNQLTIGRRRHSTGDTPDIDLSVPPEDPGVSHQHAVLVQQPDGSWAVVDQNSTNGTTVNMSEEPIQPFVPVPLQDGDRVHVGAWTTITVRRG